jgi:hypothetical protein
VQILPSAARHNNIMSLATLTSKELSRIQKLVERKEVLAQQISEINGELESIESGAGESERPGSSAGGPAAASRSARAATPSAPQRKSKGRRAVRGQLKEKITAELQSAGSQGMRVKDLAANLGTSYGNITAFFQSTGKKMREIKKIGRGQYAWVGA